jgi:dienelactone hydrolase
MQKIKLLTVLILLCSFRMDAQKLVEFPSGDGLLISANLYQISDTLPYIILCHQAGFSRGEYNETAMKFTKFMYNAFAIDMRSGSECNGVKNETALRAKEKNKPTSYLDSEQDIVAAIDYAYAKTKKKVVLVGSSYSASLCLKIAARNNKVRAVIGFSPGEYFGKNLNVQAAIATIAVPVFVASSKEEAPALAKLMADVKAPSLQVFCPASKGDHGSKALWKANKNSHEYWLAVLMFMRKVK